MNELDQRRIAAALAQLNEAAQPPVEEIRRGAVAILLRGSSLAASEVLLMKRAEREGDRWSGQIGLPGGHEEDSDADLTETARRESREEVGLDPGTEDALVFGAMPEVQARARGARIALYITPVVFYRASPETPTLGPEATEAFWLPMARVASGELDRVLPYEHEGLVHKLPSWEFAGHTIWGMTHGFLASFLGALRDQGAFRQDAQDRDAPGTK